MAPHELLKHIKSEPTYRVFVERHVLNRVPWIFGGDQDAFEAWRTRVGGEAGVNPGGVFVVGSAATGYSLKPKHAGRLFRPFGAPEPGASDIDIAVVDEGLFLRAWDVLLRVDRSGRLWSHVSWFFKGDSPENSHRDGVYRIREGVYWGAIGAQFMTRGSSVARAMTSVFSATTRHVPFRGYQPRARVYRRYDDLVGYHIASLRTVVKRLEEGREDASNRIQ